MELAEALPILQRLYVPLFNGMELRLVDDHICDRDHPPGQCPYPDSAKYTKMDALLDTPESLERRLLSGERSKQHNKSDGFLLTLVGRIEQCGVWCARGAIERTPPA
jgi:hypothetical protein